MDPEQSTMMTSTRSMLEAAAGAGAPPTAAVAVSVTTACTSRAPAARNSFWLISKAKSGYWLMAADLLLACGRFGGCLNRIGNEHGGDVVVAAGVQGLL